MHYAKESATELVDHTLEMGKFIVERDTLGDIISLNSKQSILMTYYRNNIIHLFALPSLIAHIVVSHQSLTNDEIHEQVELLYPFLKAELFLRYNKEELDLRFITSLQSWFAKVCC